MTTRDRERHGPRVRSIQAAFIALGLVCSVIFGGVSAATADTAQTADDSSAAACSWTPHPPERWTSNSGNGYFQATAVISGCSSNDHWNFQLEHKVGPFWDTVKEADWYGNPNQTLRWDCQDGDQDVTMRSRLENVRTGVVKYAPDAGGKLLNCPN